MPINKKSLQRNGGFTLVEVLMAMVILLVGLLAVASMQIMAMRGNQHARESTARTTTADNIMEWLMSHDFNANNLRITKPAADAETPQHLLTIGSDGGYELNDGDDTDSEVDATPPIKLIPSPESSKNRITSIRWDVYISKDNNSDGDDSDDGEFMGYIDSNDNGSHDTTETIVSKIIEVTVNWEGGGSTQLANIKPSI